MIVRFCAYEYYVFGPVLIELLTPGTVGTGKCQGSDDGLRWTSTAACLSSIFAEAFSGGKRISIVPENVQPVINGSARERPAAPDWPERSWLLMPG